MRQIKFRAWANDHMETSDGLLCLSNFFEYQEDRGWPLMQFTGLKDKNGKDGYESDFTKDEQNRIWLIVWSNYNPGFYFQLQENKKKFDGRIGHYQTKAQEYLFKKMEIIGNIYSNPELIKQ